MCPERTPHWLAGAPGFELGNGGIKIQVVHVIFERIVQKNGRGKAAPTQQNQWLLAKFPTEQGIFEHLGPVVS
jgi:hypothetical protein